MNLNGVFSNFTNQETSAMSKTTPDTSDEKQTSGSNSDNQNFYSAPAAVYEPSASEPDSKKLDSGKITGIETKKRADNAKEVINIQSYVANSYLKQGVTTGIAANSWRVMASGDFSADTGNIDINL